MRVPRVTALLIAATAMVAADSDPASAGAPDVDFNRDIRPILSESCYQCHGPDHNKLKADLRLDTRAGLFRSADGSTVVTPGKPEESELLARIVAEDDETRMPPPKGGKPLTPVQVDRIRRWIEQGAIWKGHWAYLPPGRPDVSGTPAAGDPIDRLLRARIDAEGLELSPETDRPTLIRRLSLDLIGLPPTPEEVDAFVSDSRPDAYERLVDRLLASPRYGERMAVFWLDLVRFADTQGYHSDNHVEIWMFRDYVIRSFNANKPFDRFTIEQLAGDLLPSPTEEARIASGYNRLLQTTQEGGAQPKEYMAKYAADRVRNVSTVWMGTTLGCAECHDHKFDPFATREFYSLGAFFADISETIVGAQQPTRFPGPEQAAALKKLEDRRAPIKAVKNASPAQKKELADLDRQIAHMVHKIPTTLVSTSMPPRVMRVLPRGNWMDDSGPIVMPDVPASLPPLGVKDRRASRLDLARWLVSGRNPLVARVMVNRLWKIVFGQGLVTTADDFGSQGTWPTHPELLDWLACEFVDSGWDVRATLKRMVMTSAYRRSSRPSPVDLHRDPGNRWLARQNAFRLDAEFVRDNALAISGLISDKIGGPSVKPYQPPGYWVFLNFPTREYHPDHGSDQYRRGLYTYWQRTFLHPSLLAFDASTREECVVQRPRSNTPLQALVLLNDPTYVEAARVLAARVIREAGTNPSARLDRAFRLALTRPPRPEESAVLTRLLIKHRRQYQDDPASARDLLAIGDAPPPQSVTPAELAAWTSITRVLLNLHETITRN
ncbi:MAG: PSD1 and planctomycete cytochrome C domain-containing protein [Isosphaeraceae bacterium]